MEKTSLFAIAAVIVGNAGAGPAFGADGELPLMETFQVVLQPTGEWWNAESSRQPSVLLADGVYRMWFMGNSPSDAVRAQIGYTTSADGIHWDSPQLVLDRPGDYYSTFAPCVLQEGSQFVMYLTQYYIVRVNQWANYIDRATSVDGIHWVEEQTVLTGTDIAYDWQGRDVYYPHVFAENSGYVMYYAASEHHNDPLGDVQSIGRATSLDGVTWTNHTRLMSNPPNANLGKPHVVKQTDGSYVMYKDNAAPPYPVIERATSLDGVTWSAFEALVSIPGHRIGSPWHFQDADGKRYLYFTYDEDIARVELVYGLVPVTISDLTAHREAASVLLTWHAEGQDVSCTVQRAQNNDGAFTDLGIGSNEGQGRVSFRDNAVLAGDSYYYRIAVSDDKGTRTFSPIVEAQGIRAGFDVWVAQSMPAHGPTVRFAYALPLHAATIRIGVYDILGRRVKTLHPDANPVLWDGCNESGAAVASGVYFVRLEAAGNVRAKRFAFMK